MTPRARGTRGSSSMELRLRTLRSAATDTSQVAGATHGFYRYPARFSPVFAAAAIQAFSSPGDLVLDPFMGGATTIVESMRLGRRSVGSDINALSLFVARVKTTPLNNSQIRAAERFADEVVPRLRFNDELTGGAFSAGDPRLRNLSIPRARPIKKLIALAIESLPELPDAVTRRFVRCALLATGQWALNGRREGASCEDFRRSLQRRVYSMIADMTVFSNGLTKCGRMKPVLVHCPVERIDAIKFFEGENKADLVLTSPPYPGIHMLYHRWQVDGRKESPAPYWITETRDGQGSAYYNLGTRTDRTSADYFANLRSGLKGIRATMKDGATIVQMVAFSRPRHDLSMYLEAMSDTGFSELRADHLSHGSVARRIWRGVPNRAWHATSKGSTTSAREVVLIHTAR